MDSRPATNPATSGTLLPARSAPAERRANIMLGNERIAVRIDADGFLTRTIRTVRLTHGIELYHAGKGFPGESDKVAPFQPGYMRLVAAMGGELVCPPAIHDPLTGKMRPNPLVETTPEGIVVRVTATAVCVVANPLTGKPHASVQTIVVDADAVLKQALLKIERDEIVQILSAEDVEEDRREKKLRGKLVLALTPFSYLVVDPTKPPVREALKTFVEQAATARQRACSKAERLAADHNPITRRTWLGSQLRWNLDNEGRRYGAPYADVDVVAWVEHRGRPEMDTFLQQLASGAQVEGVETVTGTHIDDGSEEIDDDPEPGATRALPDRGETPDPLAGARPAEREPVPVERPAEPRREPVNGQPQPKPNGSGGAKPVETSPAELAALRVRADWLESHLPEEEVTGVRTSLLERRPTDRMDAAGLRRLIAALEPIAEDLGVSVPK